MRRHKKLFAMFLSMQNISISINNFVLQWLAEVGTLRYVYASLILALYIITVFLCSLIVYVTWREENLHEPMFIFISSLVLNVMFGSSAFYPKLFVDLMLKCSTISLPGCLFQGFCLQSYASAEIFTFTAMAFDRYLAVGHPLRYPTLMMNVTSLKLILAIWVFVLVTKTVSIILTARLTFCSENIDNVYCEAFSLQRLACDDITFNSIYGSTMTFLMIIGCLLVIIFSYIRTILICTKLSREASQKATQTLVTHVVAFSTFMAGSMFVTFRYRFNTGSLSTTAQTIITLSGITSSLTLNPLIYGIGTQIIRDKIVRNLQKCWENCKYKLCL
ncbi:olfactory receptor 6N1-like [Hyperolius riggenbachi]|uniref:olfactory receptor 6N1-like n=1 Tax=Hyperolius riggenbachi TaxID=752182 RepID=UPI0035A39C69